jgi:autotransporter-associated beta strand protein
MPTFPHRRPVRKATRSHRPAAGRNLRMEPLEKRAMLDGAGLGLQFDVLPAPSGNSMQVGDAYILFNRTTGEFRMNPGNPVATDGSYVNPSQAPLSFGVNSFGVEMDPAIGVLSTDVNDYYFPSGTWPLFFPQTGANPGNAFGTAFQEWSLPNVTGGGDSLNSTNLVIGSPWVTQTGGLTGSSGAEIPGTTAVYASAIPGYEGLPEFSFGTFGPTDLTESEALAALGVTTQGEYATGNRVYSLQNVVGMQYFRVFVQASTVIGNAPTAVLLAGDAIAENLPAGSVVGIFSTEDVDPDDSFSYALVTGEGDANNDLFEIVGAELRAAASFDYEAVESLTVRVRSTDSTGLWVENAFTVTVADVNEAPTSLQLSNASVVEGQPVGTLVGILSALDPDQGDSVNFSLVEGEGGEDNGSFTIDGDRLVTAASFTQSERDSYSVRFRATDSGGLFTEASARITVTGVVVNEAPTGIELQDKLRLITSNRKTDRRIKVAEIVIEDDGQGSNQVLITGPDADSFEADATGLYLKQDVVIDAVANPRFDVTLEVFDPTADNQPSANPVATYSLRVLNVPRPDRFDRVISPPGRDIADFIRREGRDQIVKEGAGRLILDAISDHTGGTIVEAGELVLRNIAALGRGVVEIRPGARLSLEAGGDTIDVEALVLDVGGILDVGHGGFRIPQGSVTRDEIRDLIKAGRNGGTWDGLGITSSDATSDDEFSVGYTVASNGDTVVRWAAPGDTDLDGKFDVIDLQNLLANSRYGNAAGLAEWSQGDVNYDGKFDAFDLQKMLSGGKFGQGIYAPPQTTAVASLAEAIATDGLPSVDSVVEAIDTLVVAAADVVGDAGTTVFAVAASGILEAEAAGSQSADDAAGSSDASAPMEQSTGPATQESDSGSVIDGSNLTEMWRTIGLLAVDQSSEWVEAGADDVDGCEPATSVSLFSRLGGL